MEDSTTALRNYHPVVDSAWVGIELALTVAAFVPVTGFFATILSAGTLTVSAKLLPKKSDMSVLTFLQGFDEVLTAQLAEVRAGEALLIEAFEGYSAEESADWAKYVCSKPVEPPPRYVHG